MNDKQLDDKRRALELKADKVAGLPALAAAGEIKAAGLLAAEITAELARRELIRNMEGAAHE